MKVRMKVWLEDNNQPVFGEGRRRLLEAICRYGSINRAAKELGLPYRKAWSSLTAMEQRLGFKLLERRTGGNCGGGSCLTDEGHDFLRRYGELMQELHELAEEKNGLLFDKRYAESHSHVDKQAEEIVMGEENDSSSSTDNQ